MKTKYDSGTIFEALKKHLGFVTDANLAEWLGVRPQAISTTKSRGRLPELWETKITQKLGVSLDELLPIHQQVMESQNLDNYFLIPLVAARLSAGTGSFETDGNELDRYAFRYDWLRGKGNPKSMVLMKVTGDSMEPKISNNDLVLIDQSKNSIVPLGIFAVAFDDAIYIKQIRHQPGKILQLHSFNPEYSPINIDIREESPDYFRIIGKAVWCSHDL